MDFRNNNQASALQIGKQIKFSSSQNVCVGIEKSGYQKQKPLNVDVNRWIKNVHIYSIMDVIRAKSAAALYGRSIFGLLLSIRLVVKRAAYDQFAYMF